LQGTDDIMLGYTGHFTGNKNNRYVDKTTVYKAKPNMRAPLIAFLLVLLCFLLNRTEQKL